MNKKKKRTSQKNYKRKQVRRDPVAKEREGEEARLKDPDEEKPRSEKMEKEERERPDMETRLFEQRERQGIETKKNREGEAEGKKKLGQESNEDDQGNEIVVVKTRVVVPKANAQTGPMKEDADITTTNPLPQPKASSSCMRGAAISAQEMLPKAGQGLPKFGTEQGNGLHAPEVIRALEEPLTRIQSIDRNKRRPTYKEVTATQPKQTILQAAANQPKQKVLPVTAENNRFIPETTMETTTPFNRAEKDNKDIYMYFRKNAKIMESDANKCRIAADKAYRYKDYTYAMQLEQQARTKEAKAKQLHSKAAEKILRFMNAKNGLWKIDLHGLHELEAVDAVERRLHKIETTARPQKNFLLVITGKGNNSKGKPKLPEAIKNFCRNKRYSYDGGEDGTFRVQPKFEDKICVLINNLKK